MWNSFGKDLLICAGTVIFTACCLLAFIFLFKFWFLSGFGGVGEAIVGSLIHKKLPKQMSRKEYWKIGSRLEKWSMVLRTFWKCSCFIVFNCDCLYLKFFLSFGAEPCWVFHIWRYHIMHSLVVTQYILFRFETGGQTTKCNYSCPSGHCGILTCLSTDL